MNADSDGGMSLQKLHRLLIPGTGEHHRHGNRQAAVDESLQRHVDAVTHARVIAADNQRHRVGSLTGKGHRRATQKEGHGPHYTTDVRGNKVTAQCHAPALLQRTRRSAERSAGLKYASNDDPARGPALLTDSNGAAILTGSRRGPWEHWAIWAGATPPTPRDSWTASWSRPATRRASCAAPSSRERLVLTPCRHLRLRSSPKRRGGQGVRTSRPPSRPMSTRSPGMPTRSPTTMWPRCRAPATPTTPCSS